jgi:hypothetical protein
MKRLAGTSAENPGSETQTDRGQGRVVKSTATSWPGRRRHQFYEQRVAKKNHPGIVAGSGAQRLGGVRK